MRRLEIVAAVALAFLIGPAGAETADKPAVVWRPAAEDVARALDQSLQRWKAAYGVPAAAAAVTDGPTLVQGFDYGWSFRRPYPIASLSKAITAVCLSELIDQGKASFDDTLGVVLAREFAKLGDPADPRFKDITLGQLLTHTSGLARNAFGAARTLRDAFKVAMNTRLDNPPGSPFAYSNTGYLVLGVVIEDLSGQSYEKQCGRVLTDMGASGFIDPHIPQRAANGGWEVSAADYAMFAQVFQAPSKLLGKTSYDWLLSRPTSGDEPSYALGVKVKKTPRGYELFHNGQVAGAEGGGSYFLKADNGYTAVVIFSQATLSQRGYADLFQAMKRALVQGQPYEPPQ